MDPFSDALTETTRALFGRDPGPDESDMDDPYFPEDHSDRPEGLLSDHEDLMPLQRAIDEYRPRYTHDGDLIVMREEDWTAMMNEIGHLLIENDRK